MRDLLGSRSIWIAAALVTAYWVVSAFTPMHETIEFLRIAQTSVAIAVVLSYFPYAWEAAQRKWPDRVQQLSMGIALGFVSVAGTGVWLLLWRLGDKPTWMLETRFAGFLIYLSILAAALHMTAPGAVNGEIPKENKLRLGASVGVAVLVFLMIVWFDPHVPALMEMIYPYVP